MAERAVPSSVSVEVVRSRRGTGVGVVTASVVERQVLAFMGYNGWLSRFEIQRFQLLADRWNARIVIPEVPGCSGFPSRVRAAEALDLVRGDFRRVALSMVESAARFGVPEVVLGYSLGASLAAAALAAASPTPLPASTVLLVEPVAIRRWGVRELIDATRMEDVATAPYVESTLGWADAATPPEDDPAGPACSADRWSMLLTANALRRARLAQDLTVALQARPAARLIVAHGTTSRLCPPEAAQQFLATMRRVHPRVDDLILPGSHPLWHSLDIVNRLADGVGSL